MSTENNRTTSGGRVVAWIVIAVIVLGGLIPVVAWWAAFARVPWMTPTEAKRELRADDNAVLVDVLPESMYSRRHIDGAVHWPLADVRQASSPAEIPEPLRGKRLIVVCEVGIDSTRAVRHLRGIGVDDAYNVRGGKQDWVAAAGEGERYDRWRAADGTTEPFEMRPMSSMAQFLAIASGFGFKTVYSLLALIVAILLWRCREADLRALRWAMVAFFLGENACAANYVFFNETSYLLEFLHSYGMILCFGLTTYALLMGIDRRILKLSDPTGACAAVDLCRGCIKYGDVPCGLMRTFYLVIPAAIVLAAMPLCASLEWGSYNAMIWGSQYNYSHAVAHQMLELRVCPIAAIVAFAVSGLILRLKRNNPIGAAKIAFAIGAGPLGFAWLRMIILKAYSGNMMWFVFWEEATELLFILGVCFVLWIFRRGLFHQAAASKASSSTLA